MKLFKTKKNNNLKNIMRIFYKNNKFVKKQFFFNKYSLRIIYAKKSGYVLQQNISKQCD